ncbi:unnamed protein product [Urochloa humidicola]
MWACCACETFSQTSANQKKRKRKTTPTTPPSFHSAHDALLPHCLFLSGLLPCRLLLPRRLPPPPTTPPPASPPPTPPLPLRVRVVLLAFVVGPPAHARAEDVDANTEDDDDLAVAELLDAAMEGNLTRMNRTGIDEAVAAAAIGDQASRATSPCHGEQEGGDVQVPNQVMQRLSSTPRMLMWVIERNV